MILSLVVERKWKMVVVCVVIEMIKLEDAWLWLMLCE